MRFLSPLILMKSLLPSLMTRQRVGEFVSSVNSGNKDHRECHEQKRDFGSNDQGKVSDYQGFTEKT